MEYFEEQAVGGGNVAQHADYKLAFGIHLRIIENGRRARSVGYLHATARHRYGITPVVFAVGESCRCSPKVVVEQ